MGLNHYRIMSAEGELRAHSSKELKDHARPIFAQNWEQYYPTVILKDYGFERVQCPHCHHNYWRSTPERTVCIYS